MKHINLSCGISSHTRDLAGEIESYMQALVASQAVGAFAETRADALQHLAQVLAMMCGEVFTVVREKVELDKYCVTLVIKVFAFIPERPLLMEDCGTLTLSASICIPDTL